MNDTRYYHNPHCSKSRAALELLRQRGIDPVVVNHLESPPSAAELGDIVKMLGLPVRALLRTGEKEFVDLGLADESLADAILIASMTAHPRLIERPIFVHRLRAVIGRPPERVLELLE